jgi:hypothetical protein
MMFCQEPDVTPHVYLEDSLPLVLVGTLLGSAFGCVVFAVCRFFPRLVSLAGMLAVVSLGAAFTAPIGWIEGYSGVQRLEPVPQKGMVIGAAIGALLGCLVVFCQRVLDRSRPSNPDELPTTPRCNGST